MQQDIQKAVDSGKLTANAAEALTQLAPGTFVQHKSWGFGRVAGIDFLVHQMTIDFKAKKGHPMQLQYAAESLMPIPTGHIAAQKVADLSGVKSRAKSNPVSVARTVLESFGGKATQEQISSALVPDVMTETDFKRWFEVAKKAMKADGHFAIPTKKGLPFELRDGPISHVDEYLSAFNNARQLKEQVKAIELILKHIDEFKDPLTQLQPVIVALNDAAKKAAKLKPDETLALLAARDDLLEKVPGLERGADAPEIATILVEQRSVLGALLSKVPDSKLSRAVAAIPSAFGDEWVSRAVNAVLRAEKSRLAEEAAGLITTEKRNEELAVALQRSISDHSISSAALCWLCNDRLGWFSELLDQKVATAILAALERDAHAEKKDRKLHDLLVNNQELLPELIANASAEELRDFMRKLVFTTVFEDLNKRSLLGRILRIYPELQSMLSGDSDSKDESIIVSWASLERRKAEFDELVTRKIPENVKEIQIAREHGDLRENFEYKAAKDMQRVLNRRRSEMERDLSLARGTDFNNVDVNQVSIGTTVTLRELKDGTIDVYSVLGAWDTDPDKGIISYQSALAKALLGHKVGDQVDAPTEHGDRAVVIEKIEAWKK
jgi:transcription elongation GreA/GreB family factor/transcription elongation factor GreA-like protein